MNCINNKGLNDILFYLPIRIKNLIYKITDIQKYSIKEIRLRSDKPIVIVTQKGSAFLTSNGKLSYIISDSLPIVGSEELTEIVKKVCEYSIYSHQDDINKGFVTINGGHRVGLSGNAVIENGKIVSVRDISCVNFRVACEKPGCANEIVSSLFYCKLSNIIIAGPPMSGKTTVLRDLLRQISDGNAGEYYKCSLIDERQEIAGTNGYNHQCNIGQNTDVFSSYPKSVGIELALRSFSPDMIFCDEISTEAEANQIINAIRCGVNFAVSIHCNNKKDLYERKISKMLIDSEVFDYAVLLQKGENVGKIKEIINLGGNQNETFRNSFNSNSNILYG